MRRFRKLGALEFFKNIPSMPKTAILLAPGPEGVPYIKDIPDGVHIAAVNKGSMIRPCNDWVVSDSNCCKKDWFRGADKRFSGRRIFSMTAAKRTPSFKHPGKNTHYIYDMASADYTGPAENKIRKGGTVAASALWVMYYCGVKTVILVGVDMSGNFYYDGSTNPDTHYIGKHGNTWDSTRALDRVIRWLQTAGGMTILALSPTKLRSPQRVTPGEVFDE